MKPVTTTVNALDVVQKKYVNIATKSDSTYFQILNNTDLPVTLFIRVGSNDCFKSHSIDVYRNESGINHKIVLKVDDLVKVNGPLSKLSERSLNPDYQSFKIELKASQKVNANLFIHNFDIKEADHSVTIYAAQEFYELKNKLQSQTNPSLYVSLIFLGSVSIMALFSLLVFAENKSKDFLCYFGYLIFVFTFSIIADFPIKYGNIRIWEYPAYFINIKETLVYSYLICYHLFLIQFLDLKEKIRSTYKSLTFLNWFFASCIVINLIPILLGNLNLQSWLFKINTYILFAVIPYYGFVIYKLFKARDQSFFKYILWGIVCFYIGNILGTLSQIYKWDFLGLFPNNYTQLGTFFELCFFSLGLGNKMIEESKQKLRFQKQVVEVQMLALQTQMNPHFTFNCLNAIRNLVLQAELDKASLYLVKFSRLLRITLENSLNKVVSINDNIDYLKMYLEMEQLRFSERFSFQIENNLPETVADDVFLPPMLIQPFVENALKYAFENNDESNKLLVSLNERNGIIYIKIDDNGIGINKKPKSGNEHQSRGTYITKNFLDSWNLLYERKIALQILDKSDLDENETGTTVTITLL